MRNKPENIRPTLVKDYEVNYRDLPFENVLRYYRNISTLRFINKVVHKRVLEIGCGPEPLFKIFSDYDKMTIVEPGELYYKMAIEKAREDPRIVFYNDRVESLLEFLKEDNFDIIIIGGFLHEVSNPDLVLATVRKIASNNTHIYSFVPNAKSFHRLLAYEMGLISSIYQMSEHDLLFQRQVVFDKDMINGLIVNNGFQILDSATYFIKPFSHKQMSGLIESGVVGQKVLDGLYNMVKYMPDLGSEIYTEFRVND